MPYYNVSFCVQEMAGLFFFLHILRIHEGQCVCLPLSTLYGFLLCLLLLISYLPVWATCFIHNHVRSAYLFAFVSPFFHSSLMGQRASSIRGTNFQ